MALLYKEQWGENIGRDVRKFGLHLGTPHLEYLPRSVHVLPTLVGGGELGGGRGTLGRAGPSRGDGMGEAGLLEL